MLQCLLLLFVFEFKVVNCGEAEVIALVEQYEQVLAKYSSQLVQEQKSLELKCDSNCLASANYACGGFVNKSDVTVSSAFGVASGCNQCQDGDRKLNLKASTFLTVGQLTNSLDPMIVGDTCLSQTALESSFVQDGAADIQANSPKKWRYVGMPSGVYRQYPGILSQYCDKYDPRLRPWYIAATSGPKDVVFILDISGSMQDENRIDLLKSAMDTVLTTLTANDYFNIVLFSSDASFIDPATRYLMPGTAANIAKMKQLVGALQPLGSTNMIAAFKLGVQAFQNSNPNPEVPFSSNCKKAAVFLTDGKANDDQAPDAVKAEAAKLQAAGVTLFTYTLGNEADHQTAKDIACGSGGLWSAVGFGGNVRSQMTNFYQFFEILKAGGESKVVWAEPYVDANGLGKVTTAALSVYDTTRNPPVLIGVVGLDVTLQDLTKLEPNYNQLLNILVKRSNYCPKEAPLGTQERTCILERLRDKQQASSTPFGSISGLPSGLCFPASQCSSNTTLFSTRQNSCRALDQMSYPQLQTGDRFGQICGDKCKPGIDDNLIIALIVAAVVILFLIIGAYIYIVKRRRLRKAVPPSTNYGNMAPQPYNYSFAPYPPSNMPVVDSRTSPIQNYSAPRDHNSMFGSSESESLNQAFGQTSSSRLEAAPAYSYLPESGPFEAKY